MANELQAIAVILLIAYMWFGPDGGLNAMIDGAGVAASGLGDLATTTFDQTGNVVSAATTIYIDAANDAVSAASSVLGQTFNQCPNGFKKGILPTDQCKLDRDRKNVSPIADMSQVFKKNVDKATNRKKCEAGGFTGKCIELSKLGKGKGWARASCPEDGNWVEGTKDNSLWCYEDCASLHPWSIPISNDKKCKIAVTNAQLDQAKKDGWSVNKLMVSLGYEPIDGYGNDYLDDAYTNDGFDRLSRY